MRVLVTGSAGFIGSYIVRALTVAGHSVRGLDLRASAGSEPVGHPEHADRPGYPAYAEDVGDVRDPATVAGALAGADAVCHQAAMVGLGVDILDLPSYAATNVLGTAVLLAEMARAGVGRLVLASSMVVYGEGDYTCARHGRV